MTWKARVHLQEAPNAPGPLRDLGVIDLDGEAHAGSRVRFVVDGNTAIGMIEHINTGAVLPTVHISLPNW